MRPNGEHSRRGHTRAVHDDEPTLVLLPGLACDAEAWDGIAAPLSARWRVHVSDAHFRAATMTAMAERLLADVRGPLVLVGHSMGGMLALGAQRIAPERVAALALLASSARADTPELLRLRGEAVAMFEAGRVDEVLRANLPFALHAARAGDADLAERYLALVRRAGAAQLAAQNRALMARIDSRPLLAAIGCPVLVVCGDGDLLTPPEQAREIAAAVPGAQLEVLAGCGHMLTLEAPERVAALLLAWLAHAAPARRPHVT